MRIRTSLMALACCAGLAACTASGPKGPDLAVRPPKVGRPAPPSSAQAAFSAEAFTPYAALGLSDNDGLAPGSSMFTLGQACMTAAGYPGTTAGVVPVGIHVGGTGGLAFAQPWGGWGYLDAALARQSGFQVPPGPALAQLGVDFQPAASLPAAEQTAASRCGAIVAGFVQAAQDGPLAGITTLADDIGSDVLRDPAVQRAAGNWASCMARNGYHLGQPASVFGQELEAMHDQKSAPVSPSAPLSPAAQRAQISVAVTDASCTQDADLAGIYFAVQASYERQLVSANQQALSADVRRYRALYARELRRLPDLLRTAKPRPASSPAKRAG